MMAVKSETWYLFAYVFLISGYFSRASFSNQPKIVSSPTVTVSSNSNYSLFCQGHSPLQWTTPSTKENVSSWTTFSKQPEEPISEQYQYGSRLNIINITHSLEGKYYCHYGNFSDYFNIDSIYLTVIIPARVVINPKILPPHDDIIPSNSNYTLFCQGTKPLKWSTPERRGDVLSWTKFNIQPEKPDDKRYQFASRLSIINMTYPFGGFYYCHHEDVDKNSAYNSSVNLLVTTSQTIRRPQILSEYETTIEYNSKYSVLCQGTKRLKWSIPEVPSPYLSGDDVVVMKRLRQVKNFTTFTTESETPVSGDYGYASRLHIINMTYPFVGFYYCHHEDVNKNSAFESSRIYIYVNESEYLYPLHAPRKRIEIYDNVIPCMPTSPHISVELYLVFENQVRDFVYDPKVGFTSIHSDFHNNSDYQCVFSRNSKVVELAVEISRDIRGELPLTRIQERSVGHTVVGDQLLLICAIQTWKTIKFTWTSPFGLADPLNVRTKTTGILSTIINSNVKLQQHTLVVYNTTLDDKGIYTCASYTDDDSSVANLDVKIFGVGEYFLNISGSSPSTVVAVKGQPYAQFIVNIQGHTKPTISWTITRGIYYLDILEKLSMSRGEKYEVDFDEGNNVAFLKINDISPEDRRDYIFQASNNKTEKKIDFRLEVLDNPTVNINAEKDGIIALFNMPVTVTCTEYAYPLVKMEWEYKVCQTGDCNFLRLEGNIVHNEKYEFVSEVTFNVSHSGILKCSARNSMGYHNTSTNIYATDVKGGFDIFGLDSTIHLDKENMVATVAINETIAVTCGISTVFYIDIEWEFEGRYLVDSDRYKIIDTSTQYSNRSRLEIPQANYSDSGLYSCGVESKHTYGAPSKNFSRLFRTISFNVTDPQPPKIFFTNLTTTKEMNVPDKLAMACNASGIPKPTMTWYKNGELFESSDPKRIQIHDDNKSLIFLYTDANDEGIYKCEARNKYGFDSKQQSIRFKNIPRNLDWLIYGMICLILLFIVAVIFIIWKIRKENRFQREMKKLGLSNVLKRGVKHINPEPGLGDPAEPVPYDEKWEFPIYNLKLGKELGSGEFGIVRIGQAKNIVKGEKLSTVAVKVVKKSADPSCIKALASELKIMIHLGKHLNVVNLLGACTKNIVKKELLVIVEYCRFGNLQKYILSHRDNFVNQVNPETGKIEYTIDKEYFNRPSTSSDRSIKHRVRPASDKGDYKPNAQVGTADMSKVSYDKDYVIISGGKEQREYCKKFIDTKDLLVWTFQITKAMEYLASRKVLHGDLAARNILLADDNVVKICDFGLAKNIYKYGKYKKLSDGPFPVKWMAIESIRDGIFSTQSDVWSFGIVLWEFFSLGSTPYPGIQIDENFWQKLEGGYRMESPKYAPKKIYEMMKDCWAPTPHSRPSFTKLSEKIGDLLEDSERQHYVDLSNTYQLQKSQVLESGETDHLGMSRPQTPEAHSSSHDVNESAGQVSQELSDYWSIKSTEVLIPTEDAISKL